MKKVLIIMLISFSFFSFDKKETPPPNCTEVTNLIAFPNGRVIVKWIPENGTSKFLTLSTPDDGIIAIIPSSGSGTYDEFINVNLSPQVTVDAYTGANNCYTRSVTL